jgi:1-deoxy-D-xylulose-5-phosphate synthase
MGGFGGAVLEAVNQLNLDASQIRCLGIPDRFTEHGDRTELLADLGLDAVGIARACGELAGIEDTSGIIEAAEGEAVG